MVEKEALLGGAESGPEADTDCCEIGICDVLFDQMHRMQCL